MLFQKEKRTEPRERASEMGTVLTRETLATSPITHHSMRKKLETYENAFNEKDRKIDELKRLME